MLTISIHALREESDFNFWSFNTPRTTISIHALREESDPTLLPKSKPAVDFNPRSPRGERRRLRAATKDFFYISIHALREESDSMIERRSATLRNFNPRSPRGERPNAFTKIKASGRFQSTLSARRATNYHYHPLNIEKISIHALREESDKCKQRR